MVNSKFYKIWTILQCLAPSQCLSPLKNMHTKCLLLVYEFIILHETNETLLVNGVFPMKLKKMFFLTYNINMWFKKLYDYQNPTCLYRI